MALSKRIPVSKERWEELGQRKRAGKGFFPAIDKPLSALRRTVDFSPGKDQSRNLLETHR